jgi:hypothetical protein
MPTTSLKHRKRVLEYYYKNRTKLLAQKQKYRETRREELCAKANKYYADNKLAISERRKENYHKNREEIKAKRLKYEKANPDKVALWISRGREVSRRWRKRHKEEIKESKWYAKKVLAWQVKSYKVSDIPDELALAYVEVLKIKRYLRDAS